MMTILFNLIKIETLQYAILVKEEVSPPFNIDTNISFSFSENKEIAMCAGEFLYKIGNEIIMKLKVACHFRIESNSLDQIKDKDGVYIFPVFFQQHLASIMVGTARGILHEKTMGSFMNKYFLPLVDLTKIITQNLAPK